MIIEKTFLQQSAFFAKLSNFAYKTIEEMETQFPEYTISFHSEKGSDIYILENYSDIIIACRGTEVKQKSDIKADLNVRRMHNVQGKVHTGFHNYVDHIWSPALEHGQKAKREFKNIWITGHSLGAAMATLLAERFARLNTCQTPAALFTYGSPRVGNRKFINYFNSLSFTHHRWVNDGDIVTKVPIAPLFYHCGIMHHIDAKGIITVNYERENTIMKIIRLFMGRYLINNIMGDVKDHGSNLYSMHLHVAVKYTR